MVPRMQVRPDRPCTSRFTSEAWTQLENLQIPFYTLRVQGKASRWAYSVPLIWRRMVCFPQIRVCLDLSVFDDVCNTNKLWTLFSCNYFHILIWAYRIIRVSRHHPPSLCIDRRNEAGENVNLVRVAVVGVDDTKPGRDVTWRRTINNAGAARPKSSLNFKFITPPVT